MKLSYYLQAQKYMCKSKWFKFIVQTWKGYNFAARFLMKEHTGVIRIRNNANDKNIKQNQISLNCFLSNLTT